ncbi:MAG: hypothetical protein WBA13_15225 [Microcoleaceae cyanobacterium]
MVVNASAITRRGIATNSAVADSYCGLIVEDAPAIITRRITTNGAIADSCFSKMVEDAPAIITRRITTNGAIAEQEAFAVIDTATVACYYCPSHGQVINGNAGEDRMISIVNLKYAGVAISIYSNILGV